MWRRAWGGSRRRTHTVCNTATHHITAQHSTAMTHEHITQDIFETMPIISPTVSNEEQARALGLEGDGDGDGDSSLLELSAALSPPSTTTHPDGVRSAVNTLRATERAGAARAASPFHYIPQAEEKRRLLPDVLPAVQCIARARIPTTQGPEIFLHLYSNDMDKKEHLAIVFGEDVRSRSLYRRRAGETQADRMIRGAYVGKLTPGRRDADRDAATGAALRFDEATGDLVVEAGTTWTQPTLVRIHSECYTGETAWSARCDCGEQFDEAGRLMGLEGHGCIVYLRQEGRGIGLGEKLKAYNLQDLGADTVQANLLLRHPADKRSFGMATAILVDLGLADIRLLTNNPDKIIAVEGKRRLVHVRERVPMVPLAWTGGTGGVSSREVEGYLRTKVEKMGHLLSKPGLGV